MTSCRCRHHRSPLQLRSAFTLIEMLLALALLGVFFSVFTALLLAVAHERRDAVRELVALQHAANVLEDLTTRPWSSLDDAQDGPSLPAEHRPLLPEFEQQVRIEPAAGQPLARQITVTVSWRQRSGERTGALEMHGWAFAPAESQP